MGAQLRRTAGVRDSPDSSKNTIQAPRVVAFFDPGPVFVDPAGDGILVALGGATGRALRAEAQPVTQDVPDMSGVVSDPGDALDHHRDALQCPEVLVETVLTCAGEHGVPDAFELVVVDLRCSSWRAHAGQCLSATEFPFFVPAVDVLGRGIQQPCDLGLREALLEQVCRGHAYRFHCRSIPPYYYTLLDH
jgi:hypothetical protein